MPTARAPQERLQELLAVEKWPLGRRLLDLRQEATGEVYDVGHLERLLWFQAKRSYKKISKVLCSNVHPQDCTVCTTCHFCRQKTTDSKTWCNHCGDGTGIWCGNCLSIRIGENLHEVLPQCADGTWWCPWCRDLCNCSGAGCLRLSRAWGTTGQLYHEARDLHYASVAHYLVLTALDKRAQPSKLWAPSFSARRYTPRASVPQQQQPRAQPASGSSSRLAKAEQDYQHMLEVTSKQFEEAALECSLGLGILDAGDDDDEDFDAGPSTRWTPASQPGSAGASAGRGPGTPVPLFAGAGGSAAAAGVGVGGGGSRVQQDALLRQRGRGLGGGTSAGAAGAAAGLVGRQTGGTTGGSASRAGSGAAAAAPGAAGVSGSAPAASGGPPAAASDLLALLGLGLAAEDMGVLTIRACNPSLLQPAPTDPAAAALNRQQAGSSPYNPAAGSSGSDGAGASTGLRQQQQQQQQQQQARPGAMGPPPSQQQRQQAAQRPSQQQQQQWGNCVTPNRQQQTPSLACDDFAPGDLPGEDAPGWRGGSSSRQHYSRQRQDVVSPTSLHQSSRGVFGISALPRPRRSAGGSRHRAQQQQPAGGRATPAGDGLVADPDDLDQHSPVQQQPAGGRFSPEAAAASSVSAAAGAAAEGAVAAADTGSAEDMDDDVVIIEPHPTAPQSAAGPAAAAMNAAANPPADYAGCSAPEGGSSSGMQQQQPQLQQQAAADEPVIPKLEKAQQTQANLLYELSKGVGPGGLSVEELVEELQVIMNLAFEDNSAFDNGPAVTSMREGPLAAGSTCSIELLKGACEVLTFVLSRLPPQREQYPSYGDVVKRLSMQEKFVDFQGSEYVARRWLIDSATSMLETLNNRRQPHVACWEASLVLGSPQPGADYGAVVTLAAAALEAMQLAQEGMSDIVACLLDWMAVLHTEWREAEACVQRSEQQSGSLQGQELLGAFKLGPIEWLSSQELFQGQCSSMNHVELKAKEAELLEVRRMQLRMVQVQAGTVLHSLAQYLKRLFSQRQGLPRGLAAQVLRADVVAQVLDLQVPCFPQTRAMFLQMIEVLLQHAAPDLQPTGPQQHTAWLVEDMRLLEQAMPQPQQVGQLLLVPLPADRLELEQQALQLLTHLADRQLDAAARQQELWQLCCCASVQRQLHAVEALVAAEYQFRVPEARVEQQHFQHSKAIGETKVAVLAALYALQLQSGQRTWQEVEQRIATPLTGILDSFFRSPTHNHKHRLFVLFLTSRIVSAAPSLLRWDVPSSHQQQQQQGPQQQQQRQQAGRRSDGGLFPAWQVPAAEHTQPPAAAAGPSEGVASVQHPPGHVPAVLLLRLWLRAFLDQHPSLAFAMCVDYVSTVLEGCAATGSLFAGTSAELRAARVQVLQADCYSAEPGRVRSVLLTSVLRKMLPAQLSALLAGLDKDLSALSDSWQRSTQQELRGLSKMLQWQRNTFLCLISIMDLLLQLDEPRGLDSARLLKELISIAGSWVQAGIKAACGHSGQLDDSSPSGSMTAGRDADYLQGSALLHVNSYLGLIVRLAGQSGTLEEVTGKEVPTDRWPAQAVSSSSSSQSLQSVLAARFGSKKLPWQAAFKKLFCLRSMLWTALLCLSGQDELDARHAAVLGSLAAAFVAQSGLLSGQQQCQPGYTSPGLLHHVLTVLVHAVVKDAVELGTNVHVHRAVNALHFVRHVLRLLLAPGQATALLQCTQQLLLPCLAGPLLDVLRADPRRGAVGRVQLQAFKLLQQLLTGQAGRQLLPQAGLATADGAAAAAGGAPMFGNGPLRNLTPISEAQAQDICRRLLDASVYTCLATAEAQSNPQQPQQQQQEPPYRQQQLRVADAAVNAVRGVLGLARVLQSGAQQYPDLHSELAARAAQESQGQADSHSALKAGLGYAAALAGQQGVAADAVCVTFLPALHQLLERRPQLVQAVREEYELLVRTLPAGEQQQWRDVLMPAPATLPRVQQPHHQQQRPQQPQQQPHPQHQLQPWASRPQQHQGPGQATAACMQQQRQGVAVFQQHQQQRPRQPYIPPYDPTQPATCAASQACSAVGVPASARGATAAAAAEGASSPPWQQQQQHSQMLYSEAGGRVASCAWPAPGDAAEAAAGARGRKRPGDHVSGISGAGDDEEAGDCGISSTTSCGQHNKKQRASAAAAAGAGAEEQQQQGLDQPDVYSQDQGPSDNGSMQQQPREQEQQRAQDASQQVQTVATQQQTRDQQLTQQQQTQPSQQQQQQQTSQQHQQQQSRHSRGASRSASPGFKGPPLGTYTGWVKRCTETSSTAQNSQATVVSGKPEAAAAAAGDAPQRVLLTAFVEGPEARERGVISIRLRGALAERARKLLAAGLLQHDDAFLVTSVWEDVAGGSRYLIQTEKSKLQVEPSAAVRKGLAVSQQEKKYWEVKWAQRAQREQQSAERRSRSRSGGQQASGRSGSGGRQCTEQVTEQQHPCSQDQSVLGPTDLAAQQQPQQHQQQHDSHRQHMPALRLSSQPQQQHQQHQQPAGAGSDMPVQLPDAVQPSAGNAAASQALPPAGTHAAAPSIQAAAAAAVPAAARQPTVPQLPADSQATILYPSLPSAWQQ